MKRQVLLFLIFSVFYTPAFADDEHAFVTDWIGRCFAAADVAFAEVPLPKARGFEAARMKAGHLEAQCAFGPGTICRYSSDRDACLMAARTWMDEERGNIVAQLPKTISEGQSPAKRYMVRRYKDFIAVNGQVTPPGLGVEDCIGTGSNIPDLGFTRAECEVRAASVNLGQARGYARQIVAGILR